MNKTTSKKMSIQLDFATERKLRELATHIDRPFSWITKTALKEYFNKMEKEYNFRPSESNI